MRRALVVVAVVLAVAAAGVSGLWFWGAGRIEASLDAQAEALGGRGVRLGWAARDITGFPFRYVVRLEEASLAAADGSWRLAFPWTETAAPLVGGATAVTTFAPTGVLEAAAIAEGAPQTMRFALAQEGSAVQTPLTGPARVVFSADSVALSLDEPQGEVRGARLALTGLTGVAEGFADGGAKLTAAAASLSGAFEDAQGRSSTVVDALSLDASGENLAALSLAGLASGRGAASVEARVQASRSEAADGAVSSTGPATARIAFAGGRLSYVADAAELRLGVGFGAGGPRGAARAERALATLDVPTAPADAAQAYTASLAMEGLTLDEPLWAAVDPGDRLAHDKLRLKVDVGGAAEINAPVDSLEATPAAEVRTVEVTQLQLAGWGVSAEASGKLTVTPGQATPDGVLAIEASGWEPVLAVLVELGVVNPTTAADALDMAERLARPDAEPGVFETSIELREGQVWANGVRVQ